MGLLTLWWWRCARFSGLVHRGSHLLYHLAQLFRAAADGTDVAALENGLERLDLGLRFRARVSRHLVSLLLQELFGAVDGVVGYIASLYLFLLLAILLTVLLGIPDHLLDFCVGEATGGNDLHRLFTPGSLVLGRNVEDAIGVNVESDLNLRDAPGRRGDTGEDEAAQTLVVGRHGAFPLCDVDFHLRLAVGGGGKDLTLAGGDGRVTLDERSGHAPQRLDAQRQWGHVEQKHVLDLAAQDAGLDRRAQAHHLVGIDSLVGLLTEKLGHLLLDDRHARLPTHQDSLVNVGDL